MSRRSFDLLDLPPDPPSSGEPVTVFYDTEFTDLTSDAELLSIGFTAEDSDDELYVEIEDANLAIASLFVRTEILPLFGRHNPEVLMRDDAAKRIEAWLDSLRDGDRRRQVVVVSDSPLDWQHFNELFATRMPGQLTAASESNVVSRMVSMMLDSGRQQAAFAEAVEIYHRQHKQRHHALVDARAMKAAYWESRLS